MQSVLNPIPAPRRGEVVLVGAGPGDPELLTLKAARLIGAADVILYDRLVAPAILALARPDAELIFAGKSRGDHSMPQAEICARLVAQARAGRLVVRLKGGDPSVFGRGGEELAACRAAGVACSIVPGITAATAAAAMADIALTHRAHAAALTLISAEGAAGPLDHDWAALSRPGQTLAIYMGLRSAPRIAGELMAHGLPGSTPTLIAVRVCWPDQRIVRCTLAELGRASVGLPDPALILIGAALAAAHTAIPAQAA